MGLETILLSTMAASTVLQSVGSVSQGNAAQQQANAQAEQLDIQAAQERDVAVAQAEKIRRAGRSTVSAANAAFGGSGVSVGEGTPVRVSEAINRDAEDDAFAAILTGNRRGASLNSQAGLTRKSGSNANSSGWLGVGTSLLSGASSFSKWKAAR